MITLSQRDASGAIICVYWFEPTAAFWPTLLIADAPLRPRARPLFVATSDRRGGRTVAALLTASREIIPALAASARDPRLPQASNPLASLDWCGFDTFVARSKAVRSCVRVVFLKILVRRADVMASSRYREIPIAMTGSFAGSTCPRLSIVIVGISLNVDPARFVCCR